MFSCCTSTESAEGLTVPVGDPREDEGDGDVETLGVPEVVTETVALVLT